MFTLIVSALLCLGVTQTWLHEMLKVRLRQAFTYDLLDEWLMPIRAFQLPLSGEISANPDQRIQDDTRRLSELSVDLAVGLVQSSLLLLAFIGVLWELSLAGGLHHPRQANDNSGLYGLVCDRLCVARLAFDMARWQAPDKRSYGVALGGGELPFCACPRQ